MDSKPSSQPASPPKGAATRPRVVAVDDQPDSLRLLQLRLNAAGMECIPFSDGASAMKFLVANAADAIILDVMMPHMDGFEVCRRIKSDERIRDIPVVFLTARDDPADRVRGLQVGGHDYLKKPIDQLELVARTRAAVRVKQLQDQLKDQLQLQQKINHLHQEMLSEHWQKTLGQLAASLAHEINNPLAAALGGVQLLGLEEGLNEKARGRLQLVDQSLYRAGQKLRSLLLIAQTSRQTRVILLNQLVEDLITLSNFQAVVAKVAVTAKVEPDGQWFGSPSELARACLYLINNAIEAAAGRPEAAVGISTSRDDEWQYLRIADNGAGIPPANTALIFQPFFTTKGPPHNGVGLYLAAAIVRDAGGRIEFQSPTLEAATVFTVTLPCKPPLTGFTQNPASMGG